MSVETQQPAHNILAVGESATHVNSNVANFRINAAALLRWLETTVDGDTAAPVNGQAGGSDQVDGRRGLQSQDLLDATLPNTVLRRIDTRAQPLPSVNSDFQGRVQNWETLLQNINSFYQEVLQQYVTNSFPNAVEIAANTPNAMEHAARSVLLVLGAAVQCEQRADYIDAIRRLNEEEQITLIEHIREVTDESRSVCPLEESLTDIERSELVSRLYRHIVALMSQRSSLYQLLKEAHLTSERLRTQLLEQSAAADARADCDSLNATANGSELVTSRHGAAALLHSTAMRRSRSASLLNVSVALTNNQSLLENGVDVDEPNEGDADAQTECETATDQTAAGLVQRLQLELAQARGATRRLRAEADERADALAETSEQLDAANRELARLKTECVQLAHEARQSRALRDEADVLRERALRADRLELELGKARERLADLEFFRQRAEELREDTIMLEEARTLLSGRLEAAHKRLETVAELEHELTRARQSLSEIGRERDSQRDLMNDLLRELDLLRAEKARLLAAAADRDAIDASEPRKLNELDASVSDQIANAVQTRLTRVELENEKLRAQLAATNGSASGTSNPSSALQNQLEKLQAAFNNEQQARSELDKENRTLKRSRAAVADYVSQVETQMNQLALTVELFATTRASHQRQPSADQPKLQIANGTAVSAADTGPTVMVTVGQEEASRIGETSVEIDRLRLPTFATYAPFCPRCNRKLVLLKQPPAPSSGAGSRADAESQSDSARASELESGSQRPASLTDPSSDAALDPDDPRHSDVVEARRTTFRHSMRLLEARESRVRELETDNDALLAKCSSMETRARELDETRTRDAAELAATRRERAELNASLERERARTASAETRANQLDAALRDTEARAELLVVRSDELRTAQLALDALRAEFTGLNETLCTAQLDAAKARRETDSVRTVCDELRAARDSLDRDYRAAQRAITDLRLSTSRADHADAELRDARDREATLRRAFAQLQDDLAVERRRVQQADAERELARADADAAERRVDEMRCSLEEAHRNADALRTHFEEQRTEAERLRERARAAHEQLERTKTATLTVDASSATLQPKLNAIATQSEPAQQNEQVLVLQRRAADLGTAPSPSPSPSLTADMDKLLELERANARMESELVQSRSAEARAAAALADAQRQLERRSAQLETLHDEKAALESTVRSVQAQSLELAAQHGDRQAALHRAELDAERLRHSHAQLAADYRELVAEHEHLQTDFDALRADLQRRKAACKLHKAELRTARVDLHSAAADRERAAVLTAACERERAEAHEARTRLHAATAESRELAARCARLERDHEALLSEHKAARTELNEARLANLDQQGDLQECRDQLSSLDVELDKLTNQLKLANSFREQLEAENGSLLSQLDALVSQNQDLLNRLLEHRETHLAEREQLRTQLERLADQRQSLESRIVETQRDAAMRDAEYKALLRDADERMLTALRPASPSAKKKQSFGATLMRKARGFMGKRTKSNSQLNLASDNPNGVSPGPNDSPTRSPEQNATPQPQRRAAWQLGQPMVAASQAQSRLWTPQPFANSHQQNTSMDSTSHTNGSSSLSQQSVSPSTHSIGLANQTAPSAANGSQTYVLASRAMTPSRGSASNDQRLTTTARQETLSTPPRFMPPAAGSTQSKLVAGSMSVFDRTPPHSPRPGASSGGDTVELLSFLRELNEKAERRERDKAERDKARERDRHRHVQRKLSMSFGLSKANARSTPDLTKAGVKSDASSMPANVGELAGERTSTPKKQIGLDTPDGSPQSASSAGPGPGYPTQMAPGVAQHDSAMKRVLSPYLVQFQDVQTLRRKGSPLDAARPGSSASRPSTATPTTWARLATPLPANHDLQFAHVNGELARPIPRPVIANSRTLPSRPGTAMGDPAGNAASKEQPANSLRPITPALTAGTAAYRESPLGRPQPQANVNVNVNVSQTLPSRRHTQSVTPNLQQQIAAQTDQQTLSAVQRPQSSLDQPATTTRTNRHHTIVGLAAAPSPLAIIQEQHSARIRPQQLNGSSLPFARQPGLPPENERVERTLLRVRSSAFTMAPNEANRLVELQSRSAASATSCQPRRGLADDLYAPPSFSTIEKSLHHSRSAQSMVNVRRSKTPAPSPSSSSYYDTSMLQSEAASYQAQPAAQVRQTAKPYRPASTQPANSANYETSPRSLANGRPAPSATNAYQQPALQMVARPHSSMAQPVSAQLIRSRSPNPALLRNVVSPNSTPYGQAANSVSPSSSASSNKSSQHAARLTQTNSADTSFI